MILSEGMHGAKRTIVGPEAGDDSTAGLRCRIRSTGEVVPAYLDEEDNRIKCEVEVRLLKRKIEEPLKSAISYLCSKLPVCCAGESLRAAAI